MVKILHLTGALSSSEVKAFNNSKTSGLGYMVFDIATAISKKEGTQVDVFNYKGFFNELIYGKCRFLGMGLWAITRNFRFSGTRIFVKLLWRYGHDLSSLKNIIYSFLAFGYICSIVGRGKYDIVHNHGISFVSEFVRSYCFQHHIPYVITLHGLISFGGTSVPNSMKRLEKDCLVQWHREGQMVSLVSTGCMLKVKEFLNMDGNTNLRVVTNFTDITDDNVDRNFDLRKMYNIPSEAFIVLYIGNISWRKNQLSFVKSINSLNNDLVNKLYVLFLGRDGVGDESIAEEIEKGRNKDHLIICGNIPKSQMASYLSQGDATALISYSEGFGLGIIEGFRFGLPSLAIDDMDGIPDLYDESSMILLKDRENETICKGIEQLLSRSWDKEKIRQHSMAFTGNEIANKYIALYNEVIG